MIMNECIEQSVDMYGVRNVMLFFTSNLIIPNNKLRACAQIDKVTAYYGLRQLRR